MRRLIVQIELKHELLGGLSYDRDVELHRILQAEAANIRKDSLPRSPRFIRDRNGNVVGTVTIEDYLKR